MTLCMRQMVGNAAARTMRRGIYCASLVTASFTTTVRRQLAVISFKKIILRANTIKSCFLFRETGVEKKGSFPDSNLQWTSMADHDFERESLFISAVNQL
ncbi:hypothetical protein NPIL_406521 [Nephila pilipes]|uniref:Uncharacterized protein n=1 Tax=Nephila pilipes TaxID=299642 RepID=A0A8X6MV76_NEPPI|nr:hypothetical protein NPIL_406521 [Nephila pilipes]